jgi:isopentenyl diphosphate isomerase/L-lactate dehydrogenase-like FMN-dependent dehydrogenase
VREIIVMSLLKLKVSFRSTYESPIIIAPTAFHSLAHSDGEVGTARGATEAQCIYTYNWMYSTKLEEEILQSLGPKFLHIYLTMPVPILEKIVSEADQKGYRAIVITCDHSTDRVRDNTLPLFEEASKTIDPHLQNSMPMPNMDLSDTIMQHSFSTGAITWSNVEGIKKLTKLPIICKGILSPIDAELAVKHGADGIVVRFVSSFIRRTEYTLVSIVK